jgi:hypothetical protein
MKSPLQLLSIIILLFTISQSIKAEGLLRLFTTPEQRAALDAARDKPIIKKRKRKKSVKKPKKSVKKRPTKKIKKQKLLKKSTIKKTKPKKIAKKKPIKVIKPSVIVKKPPVKITKQKKTKPKTIVKKPPIKIIKPKKIEIPKPKLPRYINFEGLITRSDGTTTIWINGTNEIYREGFTIQIDKIKSDYSIPIILTYTKQTIILKPGQTYDTLEGKIKDSFMIQN